MIPHMHGIRYAAVSPSGVCCYITFYVRLTTPNNHQQYKQKHKNTKTSGSVFFLGRTKLRVNRPRQVADGRPAAKVYHLAGETQVHAIWCGCVMLAARRHGVGGGGGGDFFPLEVHCMYIYFSFCLAAIMISQRDGWWPMRFNRNFLRVRELKRS